MVLNKLGEIPTQQNDMGCNNSEIPTDPHYTCCFRLNHVRESIIVMFLSSSRQQIEICCAITATLVDPVLVKNP